MGGEVGVLWWLVVLLCVEMLFVYVWGCNVVSGDLLL